MSAYVRVITVLPHPVWIGEVFVNVSACKAETLTNLLCDNMLNGGEKKSFMFLTFPNLRLVILNLFQYVTSPSESGPPSSQQ